MEGGKQKTPLKRGFWEVSEPSSRPVVPRTSLRLRMRPSMTSIWDYLSFIHHTNYSSAIPGCYPFLYCCGVFIKKFITRCGYSLTTLIVKLLFFRFVFCERFNKGALLRGEFPFLRNTDLSVVFGIQRLVTQLTYWFHCAELPWNHHAQPQNFHTSIATTTQNRAEPRNTASQALRFSAWSLCDSSLPDGIANLTQSTSLIISTPNNRYK